MLIKSKEAQAYEESFAEQVSDNCRLKLGSWRQPLGLLVNVYYRTRRSDLSIELLKDLLQKNNVIADDRFIRAEQAVAHIDKEYPRVVLALYAIKDPDDRI